MNEALVGHDLTHESAKQVTKAQIYYTITTKYYRPRQH